jgi:hypothetical protein
MLAVGGRVHTHGMTAGADTLTVRDHMTLQYADLRGNWLTREGTLRHVFGEPATHYYARLDRLIDTAPAQAAYPALCRRLRSLRDARRAARSGDRAS